MWTKADDQFLIENFTEMTIPQLAKEMRRGSNTIRRKIKELGLKKQREFAVYRGDAFLVIGNAEQCAKFLEVGLDTFNSYRSPSKRNRKGNQLIILDLGFYMID